MMIMKGYMYILECVDGMYYTGTTRDLDKRIREHELESGAHYTAKRLQVKLVYFEEFNRIVNDAFYREKKVQGWSHAKKKALIEGENNKLHNLAECMNETHYRNV